MKISLFYVAAIPLVITGLFSCQKHTAIPYHPVSLPADGEEVVSANNQFAFRFLQASLQQDPGDNNKLISPFSIYEALSMAYNGAGNSTRDSIAKTLQLAGISTDALNAVNKALIEQMPTEDNHVTLSIANSLWYRQGSFTPLTSYLDTVKNAYQGNVKSLDFNNPGAVNTMNDWVSQHTNNKIPSILNSIAPTDMLFLINAIYFNGSWQKSFDKSATYDGNFHLQNGSGVNVPLMQKTERLRAYADTSFALAELSYGSGKSFGLYVVVPRNPQQPINEFVSSFNTGKLSSAIAGLDSQSVHLVLPRWEYSYGIGDMKPALSALGMGIAFGDGADFSNMYDASQVNVSISKAIHRAYIKVNEEGTEAAAATVLGTRSTAVLQTNLEIHADHPFLYAIMEKQTGTLLFLGIVYDPSKN